MVFQVILVAFAVGLGFAVSGIISNLYRVMVKKVETPAGKALRFAVLVFAGPNVLVGNAARRRKKKDCSAAAFWFATFIASYWSLMLGLLLLHISLHFSH